jgi:hypothetical protein
MLFCFVVTVEVLRSRHSDTPTSTQRVVSSLSWARRGEDGDVKVDGFGLPPRWERIAQDLFNTAGRKLVVNDSDRDDIDGVIEVTVDDQLRAGLALVWDPCNAEEAVARLADDLREHSLDEEVWGGSPICPPRPPSGVSRPRRGRRLGLPRPRQHRRPHRFSRALAPKCRSRTGFVEPLAAPPLRNQGS